MKMNASIILIFYVAILSCSEKNNIDQLSGQFRGLFPSDSFEGVEIQLMLFPDGTYTNQFQFIGIDLMPQTENGKWELTGKGLIKTDSKLEMFQCFEPDSVGIYGQSIFSVNSEGVRKMTDMTGCYCLVKIHDLSDADPHIPFFYSKDKKNYIEKLKSEGVDFCIEGNIPHFEIMIEMNENDPGAVITTSLFRQVDYSYRLDSLPPINDSIYGLEIKTPLDTITLDILDIDPENFYENEYQGFEVIMHKNGIDYHAVGFLL